MFAYDGWACSIEMDTFNGEVLSLMSNVALVILRLAWLCTKYPLISSIEACLWHLVRLFYMVMIVLVEYIYIYINFFGLFQIILWDFYRQPTSRHYIYPLFRLTSVKPYDKQRQLHIGHHIDAWTELIRGIQRLPLMGQYDETPIFQGCFLNIIYIYPQTKPGFPSPNLSLPG